MNELDELKGKLAAAEARAVAAEARVAVLEKQVAELLEKLNRNSRNSNKPPSTESPSDRLKRRAIELAREKKRKTAEQKRAAGGQPGHPGSQRTLLAADLVDDIVDHYPLECESCWRALPQVADATAHRAQTWELPPIVPEVIEHRFHGVQCPHCAHKTCAAFEPPPVFGPRIHAIVATLTGHYHLSRRKTASLLSELMGLKVSLGAISSIEARVSKILEPAVTEAWERVDVDNVKHSDGTSWYQCGVLVALWTIATSAATVFKIVASGDSRTLRLLLGDKGILVSDRASALKFWGMERRQICWAHLLRKFVAFSERGGKTKNFGNDLLDYVKLMFDYWHQMKAGTISRERFQQLMVPIRVDVEKLLQKGVDAKIVGLSGACDDILEHQAALWTFVDRDDVEPTNNHGERELRAFVIWRKTSLGTQSERGNRFAERMMTVAHTAKKQDLNVFDFVTSSCVAKCSGQKHPSMFA
jgi:transposase